MGYALKHSIEKKDADRLVLFYNEDGTQATDSKAAAGEIVFYLWPKWKGRHTRRINDAMYANDGEGSTTPRFGSGAMQKVICGVVSVEGMDRPDGKAIQEIDEETYGDLEDWMIVAILARLNRNNSGEEKNGGTSEGE